MQETLEYCRDTPYLTRYVTGVILGIVLIGGWSTLVYLMGRHVRRLGENINQEGVVPEGSWLFFFPFKSLPAYKQSGKHFIWFSYIFFWIARMGFLVTLTFPLIGILQGDPCNT